jgi:lysophospholipase L1-like esterase
MSITEPIVAEQLPPDTPQAPRSRRRVPIVLGLVIGLVLVALLLVAGVAVVRSRNEPAPSAAAPHTTARSVVMIGDSITDQATADLHTRFDPTFTMTVSGIGGTRADQRVPDAPRLAAAAPTQLVVDLGTNDVIQGTPLSTTIASITTIVADFPTARCVHLVDISENMVSPEDAPLSSRATALNEALRTLAAAHGWDVIDWAGIVHRYDAAHDPDGEITLDTVHPTPVGRRLLLDAISDSLERC